MARTVSLAVHKNTVERHRRKILRSDLVSAVSNICRERDIRAYAVIMIGADGKAYVEWDTGAILPMWGFPETMCAALRRDMEESGVAEDWHPPLPVHGTRGAE